MSSLGEDMNPSFNAVYLATQKFEGNEPFIVLPVLKNWDGEFQKEK